MICWAVLLRSFPDVPIHFRLWISLFLPQFFLSYEKWKTASHPQATSSRKSSKTLLTALSCTGCYDYGKVLLKSSVGDWGTDWLLSLWQGNLTDRRFSSQKASLLWGYIFGLITSAAPGDGRYAASKGECNWKAKPRKQRNNVRKADD